VQIEVTKCDSYEFVKLVKQTAHHNPTGQTKKWVNSSLFILRWLKKIKPTQPYIKPTNFKK